MAGRLLVALAFGSTFAQAAPTCCWSKWGDATTCGTYPDAGTGGLCSTNFAVKCSSSTDCKNAPSPTPPVPPTPIHPVGPPSKPLAVLVGVYDTSFSGDSSKYNGKSIYAYKLTGGASPLQLLNKSAAGLSPSWIIAGGRSRSKSSISLFAQSEAATYAGKSEGSVASLQMGCAGDIVVTSRQGSGGGSPVYLATDRTGDNVLSANYGSGSLAVLPVLASSGKLGPVKQTMEFGSQAHAHSAVFAPDYDAVFAPTLGLDAVQQLKFSGGALYKHGATVKVPTSQGPRHLKFHPTLPIAVLANEGSASATPTVILYKYDAASGHLSEIATYETLKSGVKPLDMYPAEVQFTPDGSFVLVSMRDASDQQRDGISVFSVARDGQELQLRHYESVGHYPRSMALTDDGVLIVGNQKANSLTVLQMNFKTGALSRASQDIPIGQSPAFVGVFELPEACGLPSDVLV